MELFEAESCLQQDSGSEAVLLLEQGDEEMFNIDLLVTVLDGKGLGGASGLLEFFGKAVEVQARTSYGTL